MNKSQLAPAEPSYNNEGEWELIDRDEAKDSHIHGWPSKPPLFNLEVKVNIEHHTHHHQRSIETDRTITEGQHPSLETTRAPLSLPSSTEPVIMDSDRLRAITDLTVRISTPRDALNWLMERINRLPDLQKLCFVLERSIAYHSARSWLMLSKQLISALKWLPSLQDLRIEVPEMPDIPLGGRPGDQKKITRIHELLCRSVRIRAATLDEEERSRQWDELEKERLELVG